MHPQSSHTPHSHSNMGSTPAPCLDFKDEPPRLMEQVRLLGGSDCYRHEFEHGFTPRYCNPGLIANPWCHNIAHLSAPYLMCFRSHKVVNLPTEGPTVVSLLSIAGVDHGGTVQWTTPLVLPNIPGEGVPMHEDGRLFMFNGDLFLAYTNVRLRAGAVKFRQSLVKLTPLLPRRMGDKRFAPVFITGTAKHLPHGYNYDDSEGQEKNWQFFDAGGDLAFVYTIHPHTVITPARGKVVSTRCNATRSWTKHYGEMHGGTPPIPLPDGTFLSFFNSYVAHATHQRRYMIGAYIFDSKRRDYRVKFLIDQPLLVGSQREGFLWQSPAHWEPIVAFATGAIYDRRRDEIRLSYGVNDCFAETAVFPMNSLLARMRHA